MSLFAKGVWFGFNSQCSLQWKNCGETKLSAIRNCSLFSPTEIIIFYLLWTPFAYQLAELYLKIM
jgi:hypothetical protein